MTLVTVLVRGLRKRCPQCGMGKIFNGWNTLIDHCDHCGCEIERRGGDSWFFTYMTTAFLTGLFVLFMWLYQLPDLLLEQIIIVVGWFFLIVLTLPYRKGLAIAIDYWIEKKSKT